MASASYETVTSSGGMLEYREAAIVEAGDQKLIKGDEWAEDLIIEKIEARVRAAQLLDIRIYLIDADGHYSHSHEVLYCGIFVAHWLSPDCPDGL